VFYHVCSSFSSFDLQPKREKYDLTGDLVMRHDFPLCGENHTLEKRNNNAGDTNALSEGTPTSTTLTSSEARIASAPFLWSRCGQAIAGDISLHSSRICHRSLDRSYYESSQDYLLLEIDLVSQYSSYSICTTHFLLRSQDLCLCGHDTRAA
jgi:hypothetical protein